MKLLTRSEAAKFLRISDDKLRDMAAAGELPAMKVGGKWRFIESALEDYIQAETDKHTAAARLRENPADNAHINKPYRARRPRGVIPSLSIA